MEGKKGRKIEEGEGEEDGKSLERGDEEGKGKSFGEKGRSLRKGGGR